MDDASYYRLDFSIPAKSDVVLFVEHLGCQGVSRQLYGRSFWWAVRTPKLMSDLAALRP